MLDIFGRATAKPGQKSDIESFLTSYQAIKHPSIIGIVVDRYLWLVKIKIGVL